LGPGGSPFEIQAQHKVVVVAHHRIGAEVDGKHLGEQLESLENERFAMIEVASGAFVVTTKKRTPNASAHAVVVACLRR
jgi:hypothetical protein